MFSSLIGRLVQALQILPGVGPKTATRIALFLVHKDRTAGQELADALHESVSKVRECSRCRNVSEEPVCALCASPKRDSSLICVVETPGDAYAIESSGSFSGRYFVLHGHLSPIDGVGPNELGLSTLYERVLADSVEELIVATGTSAEGEATAHYIASMFDIKSLRVTRIAHGVPAGGELSYTDVNTINHALRGRIPIED